MKYVSLLLLLAACVAPTATVTDLTRKNAENAAALAESHQRSLARLGEFLGEVEASELALLAETRDKIDELTREALRSRARALREESRASLDDALWELRGERFAERVRTGFVEPFAAALREQALQLTELRERKEAYPDDQAAQREYQVTIAAQELRARRIAEERNALETRAGELIADAREAFREELDDLLEPWLAALERREERGERSFASILAAREVEREEPRPLSFAAHREALADWGRASLERLRAHLEALETADRYLRGKRLSFLFVEGAERLEPVELPPVPTVSSLGLGPVLIELAEHEDALSGVAREMDALAEKALEDLDRDLAEGVAYKRERLANELRLELPR